VKRLKFFLLFIILFFQVEKTFAYLEIRSNFYTSYLLTSTSDFLFRSYTGLYIGGNAFAIGAVYLYDPLHDYVTDTGYGGALRIGDKTYVEFSGGYFERKYENLKGTGYFVSMIPGFDISNNFGFTLPLIAKKIDGGELDKRWIINVVPFISWRVRF
jgi:hypothetical protein